MARLFLLWPNFSFPLTLNNPGEENGNPLQYSCLENIMDRESLAGYSPWNGKESDMSTNTALNKVTEKNLLSTLYICLFGSFTFLFLKVILCCL